MSGTVSMERTRTMIEAVHDIPPLPSFLKRTFFPGVRTFITEEVDFDYMKGVRRMAPFVAPLVGGIPMERGGFETKSFKMPRISPELPITEENINKRSMGEPIYSDRTPADRAADLQARDYTELDEAITLREEWMCRELLLSGKMLAKGETNSGECVEYQIDYGFTNKEILTGADRWSDPSSDPIQQMIEWRADIVSKSNIGPDILLMRSETALQLIDNAKFKERFDLRHYDFGTMKPEIREPLLSYYGHIPIIGAELYAYDATFQDPDTGVVTPFIPENTVLFASRNKPGSMYYGAITLLDSTGNWHTVALSRVPVILIDSGNSVSTLRVVSRPLPMPVNVDGWAVKVVA